MELLRTLAVLAERPGAEHVRLARLLDLPAAPDEATWTQVFVFHLYPYASVHLGPEGQLGGEARDRVAGFFRALDAVPPPEPDRLPTLLAAYAELRARGEDGDDRASHAATTLLHEHLLAWLPLYLGRVRALAPEPYATWASLLAEVLRGEACDHPVAAAGQPAPLPVHLRDAALVADPRAGSDAALSSQLLVPSRTGFVLTGADLGRAARETGLGLRIGERRYVLEQLLGQSVPEVLRWVAAHGPASTRAALQPWVDVLPGTVGWWQDRADACGELLRDLAEEAEGAMGVVQP